ncbi:MAG: hemerythrin family protein [Treponema sp.]|jgi:hemerythrin|nr:hemerythrin family protein [Treponema sp.]
MSYFSERSPASLPDTEFRCSLPAIGRQLGNPLIDEQHRQLMTIVNDLLDACRQSRIEQLEHVLAFLRYYTAKHFFDEEVLQIQYGYPGYANHRIYHEEFKKTIHDFIGELKENGPGDELAGRVTVCVKNWLLNHIFSEDMKLVRHIDEQMKTAVSA